MGHKSYVSCMSASSLNTHLCISVSDAPLGFSSEWLKSLLRQELLLEELADLHSSTLQAANDVLSFIHTCVFIKLRGRGSHLLPQVF